MKGPVILPNERYELFRFFPLLGLDEDIQVFLCVIYFSFQAAIGPPEAGPPHPFKVLPIPSGSVPSHLVFKRFRPQTSPQTSSRGREGPVGALVLCFLALLALKVSFGSAAHRSAFPYQSGCGADGSFLRLLLPHAPGGGGAGCIGSFLNTTGGTPTSDFPPIASSGVGGGRGTRDPPPSHPSSHTSLWGGGEFQPRYWSMLCH